MDMQRTSQVPQPTGSQRVHSNPDMRQGVPSPCDAATFELAGDTANAAAQPPDGDIVESRTPLQTQRRSGAPPAYACSPEILRNALALPNETLKKTITNQPQAKPTLVAPTKQPTRAISGLSTGYTSNVDDELALEARIAVRKAEIRDAILRLDDTLWGDNSDYNAIKGYLRGIDQSVGDDHCVMLADGLAISQRGFNLEAQYVERDSTRGTRYKSAYATPAHAAKNDRAVQLIQRRELLPLLEPASLASLLRALPTKLSVQTAKMHFHGKEVLKHVGGRALFSVLCLPCTVLWLPCSVSEHLEHKKLDFEDDQKNWKSLLRQADSEAS